MTILNDWIKNNKMYYNNNRVILHNVYDSVESFQTGCFKAVKRFLGLLGLFRVLGLAYTVFVLTSGMLTLVQYIDVFLRVAATMNL